MDKVHGQAGNIVGLQHFPIDALGIVHQRGGGVHNAAIEDNRCKGAEGGKTAAAAAQETLAEAYTGKEAYEFYLNEVNK